MNLLSNRHRLYQLLMKYLQNTKHINALLVLLKTRIKSNQNILELKLNIKQILPYSRMKVILN